VASLGPSTPQVLVDLFLLWFMARANAGLLRHHMLIYTDFVYFIRFSMTSFSIMQLYLDSLLAEPFVRLLSFSLRIRSNELGSI
jgi:hypothetical protein